MNSEMIAALATPPGQGAISLLRLSGSGCLDTVRLLASEKSTFKPRTAHLVALHHRGQLLDECLVTWFQAPFSYTGEEVVEIACHGNPLIVRRILEALLESGARLARPGEFTQRAFLHGQMDLTQAEAVADLIAAQSDLALRSAHASRSGGLRNRIETLRASLINTLAHLEAWIDFPDEDIQPAATAQMQTELDAELKAIESLLETSEQGRVLREGVRTVIVGRPNVGKSSLLNALVENERAIVSPNPGTTRDTVEEYLMVKGFPLRLIDTAGVRISEDIVEQEGVRRSRDALAGAELVLFVFSAPDGWTSAEESLFAEECDPGRTLLVANKIDLPHPVWPKESLGVSATTGEGLESLRMEIASRIMGGVPLSEDAVTINARHADCLRKAQAPLQAAIQALEAGISPEFVSQDLREALTALTDIVGVTDHEVILDKLFSTFCIGK